MPPAAVDARSTDPALRVLLALADDVLHGYAIMQSARERGDGAIDLLPGTLYSTIKKMLADGLVEEADPPSNADSEDARRRYYRVTRAGRAFVAEEMRRMAALVKMGRVFLN
jgi:DNA-binding PadR family transcriptional regulator